MNNHEELLLKVRKWIELALEDLRLAKFALTMESNCPYRLIAYHSQQAAEKYLKAFLVFHSKDFPHTHSILRLLELCNEVKKMNPALEAAEELSSYAVSIRYPDESEEITKTDAVKAIALSEKVKEIISEELKLSS